MLKNTALIVMIFEVGMAKLLAMVKRIFFSVNRINRVQIQLADCHVSNDLVRLLNLFVKCVLIVGR